VRAVGEPFAVRDRVPMEISDEAPSSRLLAAGPGRLLSFPRDGKGLALVDVSQEKVLWRTGAVFEKAECFDHNFDGVVTPHGIVVVLEDGSRVGKVRAFDASSGATLAFPTSEADRVHWTGERLIVDARGSLQSFAWR
jgi:hypothetical protein